MGRVFLNEYWEIVCEINEKNKIGLSLGERIYLVIVFLLYIIGFVLFEITGFRFYGAILLVTFIFAIVGYGLWLNCSSKKEMYDKIHKEKEREKHEKIRKLLERYGIDYRVDEQICNLIQLINKQRDDSNFWGEITTNGKEIITIIILPTATYVVTKIAEDMSTEQILFGATMLILFVTICIAFAWSIYLLVDGIFNKTYRKYDLLIRDLEQIKTFNNFNL